MPISVDMPVYKNEKSRSPELIEIKSVEHHGVAVHKILLDLHTGTHVDAPRHYFEEGATIDAIKLTQEICNAQVVDLTKLGKRVIEREDLEGLNLLDNHFMIFKTQNSFEDHFEPDFVYIHKSAAHYLATLPIKGVGIDALTIEREQPDHETHKELLQAGFLVIEGLRLRFVDAGVYKMVALPIKIVGAEAAPTRVLLIEGL